MSRNDLAILVIDDMPLICEAVQVLLLKIGYTDIRIADDPKEALVLLAKRPADVVITDWNMPEIDGLEFARHIREQDEKNHRYTSIIVLTIRQGVEHLLLAFKHGIDDFMAKPAREEELAARVHAAGRIADLQNTLLRTARTLTSHNLELQEMAATDPLTGVGNRRHLQTRLEVMMKDTVLRGGVTALAVLDIDHFKQINDSHGHATGDEVLIAFARRLQRAARPTDIVARLGGEEFALVMHHLSGDRFHIETFERILHDIGQYPIKTAAGELTVTASMGVCCYGGGEEAPSPETFIERADAKLYQAKRAGRNRVVY